MDHFLDSTMPLGGPTPEEKTLLDSDFIKEAISKNLFSPTVYSDQSFTVFVPLNGAYVGSPLFEEMWNRHRVPGHKTIGREIANQQLASCANLVYSLFHDGETPQHGSDGKSGFLIGGASIETFWNLRYMGLLFHGIRAESLPDIRPSPGVMSTLKTCYLSGEEIDVRFETSHLSSEQTELTLVTSLTTADRSNITSPQRTAWVGAGTACRLIVPNVTKEINRAMLWFALVDNDLKFPLVTTTLAWFLDIVPNVEMQPNVSISDINPRVGAANEQLWIDGHQFHPATARVMVGEQNAQILFCNATLIKCIVPAGTGKNLVWVANGNVVACFDGFQYRGTA